MVAGQKRVGRVPREWVEQVGRQVDAGRRYREAVAEIFAINAQLLVLARRRRARWRSRPRDG